MSLKLFKTKKSLNMNLKEYVGALNPNVQVFSVPLEDTTVCHGFGVWLISSKDNRYLPLSNFWFLNFDSPFVSHNVFHNGVT